MLWQLHVHGRQRFNDLRDLVGGVTAKVLTQRLRQLERDGLVSRTTYPQIPPRVEYEITELGASLAPSRGTGHLVRRPAATGWQSPRRLRRFRPTPTVLAP